MEDKWRPVLRRKTEADKQFDQPSMQVDRDAEKDMQGAPTTADGPSSCSLPCW